MDKRDHDKYYLEVPDSDFSPQRNKSIIEESIKNYEKIRKQNWKLAMEANRERADASASFLRHADKTGNGNLGDYFTKKTMAYLRGDQIFSDIRMLMETNKLNVKKK